MFTVRQALTDFLDDNGFTIDDYDAPTVAIPIGPLTVHLPNTAGRKKVVGWHDLHHVATGYGTDLVGEAEIGVFELRAGCPSMVGWVYNGMAVALGLVLAPRRVFAAFRAARGKRTLYGAGLDYADALALPLATLRARMGLDR
ncbi:MAG: hypothetical protein AB8I08_36780 [Sandaracinaceae bacterium]